MIHNTVPRATPSEGLVPLLHRHRALWDSPEAGYPKHRGAPPSWRLNTRPAPLAGALPHRHSMRRTSSYSQAAAAPNAQNGETSDVAPAPKMFAFMVLPGGLTAGTGNHNVKQQGPLDPESSYALRPGASRIFPRLPSAGHATLTPLACLSGIGSRRPPKTPSRGEGR
jgi:hypothetical protein